nr:MAG TPA: hypothetical protein [Caudoviricetes sp.]
MAIKELYKVQELINKCMEVNMRGKAEVFFQFSPHVRLISISIHSPSWKEDRDGKKMECYYDLEKLKDSLKSIEKALDEYM